MSASLENVAELKSADLENVGSSPVNFVEPKMAQLENVAELKSAKLEIVTKWKLSVSPARSPSWRRG